MAEVLGMLSNSSKQLSNLASPYPTGTGGISQSKAQCDRRSQNVHALNQVPHEHSWKGVARACPPRPSGQQLWHAGKEGEAS